MGVVEGWPWLLVQRQQLPWLLWPVHLIVIIRTMFVKLKGHPQFKAQQPIYCSGPLKVTKITKNTTMVVFPLVVSLGL